MRPADENLDSILISSKFIVEDILPKEKKYLYKFFKSKTLRIFVRYYNLFRDHHNFSNHSGIRMTVKKAGLYRMKFELLEKMYDEARKAGDFELIAMMESGKLPEDIRKKIEIWFAGDKSK